MRAFWAFFIQAATGQMIPIYFWPHSRFRRENVQDKRNQFDLLYSRRVQVQQEKHWSNAGYCKRKVHSHQSLCSHNLHPIYRTLLPTSCSHFNNKTHLIPPMMLRHNHIVRILICRKVVREFDCCRRTNDWRGED